MYDPLLLLEIYLPSIFRLFRPYHADLEQLKTAYSAREKLVIEATRDHKGHNAEGIIFDLWWKAREENRDDIALLDFIDKTVESLVARIPSTLHSPIRRICKQMLFKYDDFHSEYTRHLAELAVIELFVRSGEYQLEQVEYKLPNGKSVDFLVSHKTSEEMKKKYLFEIYMIDFFNIEEKIESAEDLRLFIDKRLGDKWADKTKEVDLNSIPPLALVPVLRGELNHLIPFEEGIAWLRSTNIVADPYILTSRQEKSGPRYYFLQAKEWFNQVRKQKFNHEVDESMAIGRGFIEKGRELTKKGQEFLDWGQVTKDAIPFIGDAPTVNLLMGTWASVNSTAGGVLRSMGDLHIAAAGGSATFAATTSLTNLMPILTSAEIDPERKAAAASVAGRIRDLASLPMAFTDVSNLLIRFHLDVGGHRRRSPLEQFKTSHEAFTVTPDDSNPGNLFSAASSKLYQWRHRDSAFAQAASRIYPHNTEKSPIYLRTDRTRRN